MTNIVLAPSAAPTAPEKARDSTDTVFGTIDISPTNRPIRALSTSDWVRAPMPVWTATVSSPKTK
ncbi:hypothetical protein [Nonomuraea jiangxiensis]|uniref:hypothetical protein n=1 Tax=Nonomuraea jiangxiensis TaxID=633440 RepID=UPI001FE33676|nr:hypothetical protein [Nonomuraea jiangxiensis]